MPLPKYIHGQLIRWKSLCRRQLWFTMDDFYLKYHVWCNVFPNTLELLKILCFIPSRSVETGRPYPLWNPLLRGHSRWYYACSHDSSFKIKYAYMSVVSYEWWKLHLHWRLIYQIFVYFVSYRAYDTHIRFYVKWSFNNRHFIFTAW